MRSPITRTCCCLSVVSAPSRRSLPISTVSALRRALSCSDSAMAARKQDVTDGDVAVGGAADDETRAFAEQVIDSDDAARGAGSGENA